GAITWEARGSSSTIDLTFGSKLAFRRLIECSPRLDLDQGSDHLPLATRISLKKTLILERKTRLWKKMDK
ncbi:hypothetical protein B0J14DRAFT_445264, partial [Halenospora varia]